MARQRLRADIEERRMRVAELLMARRTERQMARELGVSLGTVNSDVKAVRADWLARRLQATDTHAANDLATLHAVEAIIWDQVKAGKLFAVDRLLRIHERRAALLGLDAPKRMAVGGDPDNQTPVLLRLYDGVNVPTADDGDD